MDSSLQKIRNYHTNGGILTPDILYMALEYDNVECLEYLYENNCPGFKSNNPMYDVCELSYKLKSYKCLKYLVNKFGINNLLYIIIYHYKVENLKEIINILEINLDNPDHKKYFKDDYIEAAITNNIDMVKYIYNMMHVITKDCCYIATILDKYDCFTFLYENGGKLTKDGYNFAYNNNMYNYINYYKSFL